MAGLDVRPHSAMLDVRAALCVQCDGLASRERLSKREQALLRALRGTLRRFGAWTLDTAAAICIISRTVLKVILVTAIICCAARARNADTRLLVAR